MYRRLIDAENRHDLKAVRPFLWTSPAMLFVAKTLTPWRMGSIGPGWPGALISSAVFHDLSRQYRILVRKISFSGFPPQRLVSRRD